MDVPIEGSTHPTQYWHRLDDGRVQCDLCPRFCKLRDGQRGLCFVRGRQNDAIVPQRDITLRLRRDLFNDRNVASATLYTPKTDAVKLTVTSGDEYITVQVPDLSLWALLELSESRAAP